ncbi:chemoreceptor glutamine deamidase CheD [Chitinimonas lacunae]|uniref:Probable chemoreceptor glutamine deamidase CheD n=1 Tax=Chitinimonas lacunae TaxID=1963018 RepID=A0ABV8MVP2_9NEIS
MSVYFGQQREPNRYFDKQFDREAVKILPGEYYATRRDQLLVTVVGSCVTACLRDPVNGVVGINHFMLPEGEDNSPPVIAMPTRYGTHAMEALINDMIKLGAERRYLGAKVFGGGDILHSLSRINIGRRNVEFIRRYLDAEAIPLHANDTLGNMARKVYFFSDSGKVWVKRISRVNNDTIVQRELEYRAHLYNRQMDGGVTLFSTDLEKEAVR